MQSFGAPDGEPVDIEACVPSKDSQKWTTTSIEMDGSVRSIATGACLDIDECATAEHAKVWAYTCHIGQGGTCQGKNEVRPM